MRVELLEHPVWRKRARQLASILYPPREVRAVIVEARRTLGWTSNLTRQVLAAGDGHLFVYENGHWRRVKP